MKRFLERALIATVALGLASAASGPAARADDDVVRAQLAALQKAVDELRAEIQANQAETKKLLGKVRVTQDTMIRRGVVISQKADEAPKSIGAETSVALGDAPSLGDPSAPIEVVEFAEFQCPFCMREAGLLRELSEEYPGLVRVGFKHYPIGRHKMSTNAAKAAWAAQRQGKFWEMHDALFAARGKLDADIIRGHGEAIGLDMEQFDRDFASPEASNAVFRDRRVGRKNGVRGTPTFYVNGRYYGSDKRALRSAIAKEIAVRKEAGKGAQKQGEPAS